MNTKTNSPTPTEYRGYTIEPKRDFGPNGGHGFLAILNGCNAMPGATWFQSIEDTECAIDALIQSEGNSDKFWYFVRCQQIEKKDAELRAQSARIAELEGALKECADGLEFALPAASRPKSPELRAARALLGGGK